MKWGWRLLIAWGILGPLAILVILLLDMYHRIGVCEDRIVDEEVRGQVRDIRIEDSFEVSRRCCTP